ncbi:MAG: hypothetical protein ABEK36_04490, partial [Candidatus Aenigmatarchaeota archaeon]
VLDDKTIYTFTKSIENLLWSRLHRLRGVNMCDEDIPLHYPHNFREDFIREGFNELGLSEKEIENGSKTLKDRIHEISIAYSKMVGAHERGHDIVSEKIWKEDDYRRIMTYCNIFGDEDLQNFVQGIYETLPETVQTDNRKGAIPYAIENDQIGLIYLDLSESEGKDVEMALKKDIIHSLWNYSESGNKCAIEKANKIVHKIAKTYAKHISKIHSNEIIPELTEMKKDFDEYYM